MSSIKMPRKPKLPKAPKGNSIAAYQNYIKKIDALDKGYRKAVADARRAQAQKQDDKRHMESLKKAAAHKRATFCKVK